MELVDRMPTTQSYTWHKQDSPLMKLAERMPRVRKAVIKAKGGYFEESTI